jgi:hypothetical protein
MDHPRHGDTPTSTVSGSTEASGASRTDSFERQRRPRATPYATEKHAGALAATAWLAACGLRAPAATTWDVAIALDIVNRPASPYATSPADTRFHIAISTAEWGFYFCQRGRVSWIRVTDVPFVNERDDHGLLRQVPPLRDLGWLIQTLELRNSITFRRTLASVRTNLVDAEIGIRSWITTAL